MRTDPLLPFFRSCDAPRSARVGVCGVATMRRWHDSWSVSSMEPDPIPVQKGIRSLFKREKSPVDPGVPAVDRAPNHPRCSRGGGFARRGDRSDQLVVGGVLRGSRRRRRATFDAWRSMDAVVDELDDRDIQRPPYSLVWEPWTQVGSRRRTGWDSSMDGPDARFSSHRRAAPSSAQGFPHLHLLFSRVSPNATSGRTGSSRSVRLHPLTLSDVALGSGVSGRDVATDLSSRPLSPPYRRIGSSQRTGPEPGSTKNRRRVRDKAGRWSAVRKGVEDAAGTST